MEDNQIDQVLLEQMKELQEDESLDAQEEQNMTNQAFNEAHSVNESQEQYNSHNFLADSINFGSPEKVTYLTEQELGRPLFSVRFLLDLEDICYYYIDDLVEIHGGSNKVALYFRRKVQNISDSGMSNEGFIQTLNVTRKMDMTRTKKKTNNIDNLKGGRNKNE